MTKEELTLATIEFKLDQLTQKVENLTSAAEKGKDLPEWVSLALAVEKKGGCSLATYRTRYYLQPCCGTNSKLIGGGKSWPQADVIEWLAVDDSMLELYARKYGIKVIKH